MEIRVWVVTYTTWCDDEHELYNEVQVCASKEEAIKVLKQYKRSELDSGHFSFNIENEFDGYPDRFLSESAYVTNDTDTCFECVDDFYTLRVKIEETVI